jgi:hydroxymethylpyrimidine/phosphomethylpyrimidine kinase
MVNDLPRVALTIAGSDSGGGAGIQADLKTFEAFGVWGTCAITAVTAQNTLGVHDSLVLPPTLVRAQIDAVVDDLGVAATKTGMLGSATVIEAVAAAVSDHGLNPLVVDPVLVTSHGDLLLETDAMGVLRRALLPLASVITPNIPEAEALLDRPIEGVAAMEEAAA